MSIQHSTPTSPPPPPSGTDLRARALAAVAEKRAKREAQDAYYADQARRQRRGTLVDALLEYLGVAISPETLTGEQGEAVQIDGVHFGLDGWELVIFSPCADCGTLLSHTKVRDLVTVGEWLERGPGDFPVCPDCYWKREEAAAALDAKAQEPKPISVREAALRRAADASVEEALRACRRCPPFNSTHEGYAVLLEEVDELWDEVKGNNRTAAVAEAIQAAAMAIRFVAELDPEAQ